MDWKREIGYKGGKVMTSVLDGPGIIFIDYPKERMKSRKKRPKKVVLYQDNAPGHASEAGAKINELKYNLLL